MRPLKIRLPRGILTETEALVQQRDDIQLIFRVASHVVWAHGKFIRRLSRPEVPLTQPQRLAETKGPEA